MLIESKITPLNSLTDIDTIVLPSQLIEFVALKASIPALGLWVLLCSQKVNSSQTKQSFCEKYQLSNAAFDKTMNKLASLNLAWQTHTVGVDDWQVANLPKDLTEQAESFLGQLENLFISEQSTPPAVSADKINQSAYSSSVQYFNIDNSLNTQYQVSSAPLQQWDTLELPLDFFDIAATKIPKELVQQYWDSFIATNDNKGEVVPERKLLYKKWKAYIASVSVNLAVSDRRFTNNVEQKAQTMNLRDQQNIDAWQALMEQPIPQDLTFETDMNGLSDAANDVWLGFIQQNIRFKNEVMNHNSLKYAFAEYCKTSGQKFVKKQSAADSQIDEQLNDTSWANNLDDVL